MRPSHDIGADPTSPVRTEVSRPGCGGAKAGPRVWNGRNVVLFLGALMVLIAMAMAMAPGALLPEGGPTPPAEVPMERPRPR